MLAVGGLTLAAAALALGLGRVPLARSVEWTLYDARMRQTVEPDGAPRDLVMVEIDELTVRELEPLVGRWPWPRAVHAMLIDYFARAPARLVVYDVLFIDRDRRERFDMGGSPMSGAESDRALVDAVAAAGNVVLLAEATFGGQQAGETATIAENPPPDRGYRLDVPIDERPAVTAPFPELAARGASHRPQPLRLR